MRCHHMISTKEESLTEANDMTQAKVTTEMTIDDLMVYLKRWMIINDERAPMGLLHGETYDE